MSSTVTIDGIIYTLNTNTSTASVSGYNNNILASSTIQSIVESDSVLFNVTSIGDAAFENCSLLTSISIPNTVIIIGNAAFQSCVSLPSIVLPNSVTSIGTSAFQICSLLTDITISNSVTSISDNAFAFCSSLPSITISDSIISIGGSAFEGCNLLNSIIISSSVTSIGSYAFSSCPNLINVQIRNPNNVITLGLNAFTNVSSTLSSRITYYNTTTLPSIWVNSVNPNFANVTIYSGENPCFNEGTKILALNKEGKDEYIEIEKLQKGDLVKTYKHGYRRIELIGKSKMANDPSSGYCMHKMEMNKKNVKNGLLEDLIVTGNHSILVSDLGEYAGENTRLLKGTRKIDDKYLLLSCVSKDFKKIQDKEIYTYYHFALEHNKNKDEQFGVWANGILTETMSVNKFLRKFNNNNELDI
jgi:hypothetical protein